MSDENEPSGASGGSRAELTSRLAKTIGADPTLTQSIRIDVNVRNEPTVTVTRLADADQIGRIIQCSTFADYTLVENKELKRLRKGDTLTDAEREAVERAAQWMVQLAKDRGEIHSAGYFVDDAATLRGLLERLGGE